MKTDFVNTQEKEDAPLKVGARPIGKENSVSYNSTNENTVCLISLGCPKNLVVLEVMLGLLSNEGYLITTDLRRRNPDHQYVFLHPGRNEKAIDTSCSILLTRRQSLPHARRLDACLSVMGRPGEEFQR